MLKTFDETFVFVISRVTQETALAGCVRPNAAV